MARVGEIREGERERDTFTREEKKSLVFYFFLVFGAKVLKLHNVVAGLSNRGCR